MIVKNEGEPWVNQRTYQTFSGVTTYKRPATEDDAQLISDILYNWEDLPLNVEEAFVAARHAAGIMQLSEFIQNPGRIPRGTESGEFMLLTFLESTNECIYFEKTVTDNNSMETYVEVGMNIGNAFPYYGIKFSKYAIYQEFEFGEYETIRANVPASIVSTFYPPEICEIGETFPDPRKSLENVPVTEVICRKTLWQDYKENNPDGFQSFYGSVLAGSSTRWYLTYPDNLLFETSYP